MTATILPFHTTTSRNRKSRRAMDAILAPEDVTVVYELDGITYPEGLELISSEGLRKLTRHIGTPLAREFQAWADQKVMPHFGGSR